MKLKFDNVSDGSLPPDVNLYLKCPRCNGIFLWRGYPGNPVLSTVVCKRCGFTGMGSSIRKAIKKQKAMSIKEKAELFSNYLPPKLNEDGSITIPYNAPANHPARVELRVLDALTNESDRALIKLIIVVAGSGAKDTEVEQNQLLARLTAEIKNQKYQPPAQAVIKKGLRLRIIKRERATRKYRLTAVGRRLLGLIQRGHLECV
jgi:hypothetical protein